MDKDLVIVGLIVAVLFLGSFYIENKDVVNKLESITARVVELENLNKNLEQENKRLVDENSQLKKERDTLSKQMAKYLVEQGIKDLFGLKKYGIFYDLVKISICDQDPSLTVC